MKKILINENSQAIETDLQIIEQSCFPAIEKIQKMYLEFNLGELTTELLHDALSNNSTEIEKLFVKQADQDTANVKNPVLRSNLMNGIKEAIINFRLSVNSTVALCDRNLLKLLTIEENGPSLNDTNMEKLKETHRKYATPEEARFYELHKNAAKALTELFANKLSSLSRQDMMRVFRITESEISPEIGVNYSYFLKEKTFASE